MNTTAITRRSFLRASGISLALPFLDAMLPRSLRAAAATPPRRFIAVCGNLGYHPPFFFPIGTGRNYGASPYLALLKEHRGAFTVFSGLSHPDHAGVGHASDATFLTAARNPGRPGFRNSVSLDQFIARKLGQQTRFQSLALNTGGGSLSWTESGVQIPGEGKPSQLFAKLFLAGTPAEIAKETQRLREGRSIMDAVGEQAKSLARRVNASDRDKLDEYFTSVRDMEKRLHTAEEWMQKPKPTVALKPPTDIANNADVIGRMNLVFDLMPFILQTDSTRLLTLQMPQTGAVPPIPGVTDGYHALSHHGQDESKIAMLRIIEEAQMKSFNALLTKLKAAQENGQSLLDNTTVLFGSNLSNANAHKTDNLPILVAGGGFKHGQHLAFDEKNNTPFANLFVQIARRMGVETETFGSSTKAGVTGFDA